MTDLVVGDFGVNLCGGDVFVSEHLADRLQGNTLREGDRGRKVCLASCIVGLNDNPAWRATCRRDIFMDLRFLTGTRSLPASASVCTSQRAVWPPAAA